MKKFGLIISLVALTITPMLSFGAEIDDLRAQISSKQGEIDRIEAEIAKYQKTLDATENKSKTLTNEVAKLNARVKQLSSDISLTQAKISKTELDIARLGHEIGTTEADINLKRNTVSALIRDVQGAEQESMLEILLKYDKISEFFQRVESLKTLNKSLGLALEDLRQRKEDLEINKSEKEIENTQLASLKTAFSIKQAAQAAEKKEKAVLLSKTKEQEAAYQKIIAEREKVQQAIQKEIAAYEEELRKLIDPSTLPPTTSGVLAYPLANPVLTQGFGRTSFASTRTDIYVTGSHNGIDLRASIGTTVMAASGGVVWDTGNTDLSCPGGSYGKWVLIKHPNNLATIYGHLSGFIVSKGDIVERGQPIAYSGKSGYSTGPHLHFTVYDARTVRFGPSASGRCTYLPYGGYLNPLSYL